MYCSESGLLFLFVDCSPFPLLPQLFLSTAPFLRWVLLLGHCKYTSYSTTTGACHENPLSCVSLLLQYFSVASFFVLVAQGTQFLLNNVVHTFLFAIASTLFFRKRIPYEEESLIQYFPDQYPSYRERTWIGIPFMPTVDLEKTS